MYLKSNMTFSLGIFLALCTHASAEQKPTKRLQAKPITQANNAALEYPRFGFYNDVRLNTHQLKTVMLLNQNRSCTTTRVFSGSLPQGVALSVHEHHVKACGNGDPHTEPRIATYEIDKYGRAFLYNVVSDSLTPANLYNTKTKIINLKNWQHPAKKVFQDYDVTLTQLESLYDGTFVVFTAEHDFLLKQLTKNDERYVKQQRFFQDLLKANGNWDFMIQPSEEGMGHVVYGKHRQLP